MRMSQWSVAFISSLMAIFTMLPAGCASQPAPSHIAKFGVTGDREVTIVVAGEKPVVKIINYGPGAIGGVHLIQGGRVVEFCGIPPVGNNMFTLSDGDAVRLVGSMGCDVGVKIWNAASYELESSNERRTALASSGQDVE